MSIHSHTRTIMNSFQRKFLKVLDGTNVSRQQKLIIKERYLSVVTSAEYQYRFASITYILFNNITTLCGILISAFVSFDQGGASSDNSVKSAFLWTVWILGILLAVSNGLLNVFNINKKYVLNYAILEKLYSEGWSFVTGINKYSKFMDTETRFKLFCERIEKIKLKAIGTMQDDGGRGEMDDILSTGFDESGGKGDLQSQTNSRRSKKLIFNNKIVPNIDIIECSQHVDVSDNILTEETDNQQASLEQLASGGLVLATLAVETVDAIGIAREGLSDVIVDK